MKQLFKHLDDVNEKLKNSRVMLFLDFDGTLAPIAETPDKAVLPLQTKKSLRRLAASPRIKIAIVSGRSLRDVKRLVGLKKLIYAGNHGLEIAVPGFKPASLVFPGISRAIQNIGSNLKDRLSGINGIIVEDKGLTLSVHYRLAAKADFVKMRTVFREIVGSYLAKKKIKVNKGKMVFEVKPPIEWGKGHAVRWLIERLVGRSGRKNVLPIYIGDDVTDEEAFKAIGNKGLTIFIGEPKKTSAQYYLKDHGEVGDFLKKILEIVKSKQE